jgi:hypothetical protein
MAAPTITARTIPTGYRLPEGFKITIAFALQPAVQFWEKAVKPGGIDGGEPLDFTTQHNIAWHTSRPRKLKKKEPYTATVAYDPDCLPIINGMINSEDSVTIHWPENSTDSFYGYLQKFEPKELKVGEPPEAEITIAVTNWDPTANVEQGPVFTPAAGT